MRDYLETYLGQKTTPLPPPRPGKFPADMSPRELTKLTKPLPRRSGGSFVFVSPLPPAHPENKRVRPAVKRKVWRGAPCWQTCAEATRLPSGELDLENADLLYAALALGNGHTPEETREMLRRCTPRASTRREYCADVVRRVSDEKASHVTTELAARYAKSHPYAWELSLK